MTGIVRLLSAGLLVVSLGLGAAAAQPADTTADSGSAAMKGQNTGKATLANWPGSLTELLRDMGKKAPYLLPRLDSLAIEYRYASNDSTSQWSFVLGWDPGRHVLYRGEVLAREEGPADVRMVSVELRADVRVEGEPIGEMIIAVDSMALRPLPSIYSFEVTVGHDRVFLNTTAAEARRALAEGVTLDRLVVERMGFTSRGRSSAGE